MILVCDDPIDFPNDSDPFLWIERNVVLLAQLINPRVLEARNVVVALLVGERRSLFSDAFELLVPYVSASEGLSEPEG